MKKVRRFDENQITVISLKMIKSTTGEFLVLFFFNFELDFNAKNQNSHLPSTFIPILRDATMPTRKVM